jgi:hypothetical protein
MHSSIITLGLAAAAVCGSAPRSLSPLGETHAAPSEASTSSGAPASSGVPASSDAFPPSSLRSERFVLASSIDGAPLSRAKPIACIEWRRLAHDDGFQVECEMMFERSARDLPCQRVLHVEELCDSTARLVWREMGAGSGRSLLAEWEPGGSALRTVEWDKSETLREEIDARDGAVMPLYLIEMLRQGRATTGRYPVFDPLSRSLAEVEVLTSYGADPEASDRAAAPSLRTVELMRSDGSLFGRYCFRGAELVAFQWQDGGPWARRASAAEFGAARAALSESEPKSP